jgi:hypothetical protein
LAVRGRRTVKRWAVVDLLDLGGATGPQRPWGLALAGWERTAEPCAATLLEE